MAGWNVLVGAVTVLGMLSYTLLGCSDNERGVVENYGLKYADYNRFIAGLPE